MNVDKFGRYSYTGMTIDKFGRHTAKERLRGPKGEGFKLTEDGSYDMENKRLVNVSDPTQESDCANLKTVQTQLKNCMTSFDDSESFDAQNKRISNTKDPVLKDDVVTKGYFNSHTPFRFDDTLHYSFHQYRLGDLGPPQDDSDAVTLSYVKNETITKKGSTWDCNGVPLKNVGKPKEDGDAVNLLYVTNHIPKKSNLGWSFSGKKLQKVGTPEEPDDAINIAYFQEYSMDKTKTGDFDAKKCKITNLGIPSDLDDAVSKRYLKTVLSELGYVVYKSIMKKGARSRLVSPEQWKSKVLESSWENLFNEIES
jgi:hypothetical protein